VEIKKRNFQIHADRMANMPRTNVKHGNFHHSAGNPMGTAAGINRWHIDGRGWAGIGYHFVIDAEGTIYQGRDLTKEGVHAGRPANGNSWAICLLGNFENYAPTDEQYAASQWLWDHLNKIKKITPEEHRDHMNTACPGKYFDLKEATKPLPKEPELFYRVVTGSFGEKENAERRVRELDKAGFQSFITTFKK